MHNSINYINLNTGSSCILDPSSDSESICEDLFILLSNILCLILRTLEVIRTRTKNMN